jgi:glycolate oxidase iron-sulfur subunit
LNKEIEELASHCIRCGFCLESCPTFVITGEENSSPRGRIYLMRGAEEGKVPWSAVREDLDSCLGCRACETACPSGVEYGALLELSRQKLEQIRPDKRRRTLLDQLTNPAITKLQFAFAGLLPSKKMPSFVARMWSDEPAQALLPIPQKAEHYSPLDEEQWPPIRGEVVLLEGCAMRVLFPNVHLATRRLLRRVGYRVRPIDLGCCGALHAHSGFLEEGESRAKEVARRAQGLPIISNSAGCGSWLKDAGVTATRDLSEFLLENSLISELQKTKWSGPPVTYHAACHLAHGQKITAAPLELLGAIPGLDLRPLEEADRCCGSAGTYNLTQPTMARTLLERKWGFVEATGAGWVVTGNPGCHAWIEQASRERGGKIRVIHTAEALETAFRTP